MQAASVFFVLFGVAAAVSDTAYTSPVSTCHDIKSAYQNSQCCNSNLEQTTNYLVSTPPDTIRPGTNPCAGKGTEISFPNTACTLADGMAAVDEQAGANVTAGYVGGMVTDAEPIRAPYHTTAMCPVNVHWHLGAEHLSVGEFDENGSGPDDEHRRLGDYRLGHRCHHYDSTDPKFTTPYAWKHCHSSMKVGETYEVHWPHSAAGACGTVNQYQTPFYDGVLCGVPDANYLMAAMADPGLEQIVGVESQTYTIVNDEHYYYPDMMRGMIKDDSNGMGQDIASYTGSTTGTSRDNDVCSQYTPITWQVDRKCHMISASAFDKMCGEMMAQRDDMTDDLYAHGSRETVAHHLAADNIERRK